MRNNNEPSGIRSQREVFVRRLSRLRLIMTRFPWLFWILYRWSSMNMLFGCEPWQLFNLLTDLYQVIWHPCHSEEIEQDVLLLRCDGVLRDLAGNLRPFVIHCL